MQRLIIYKASAGSGKTYKLTEEYLGLALRIPFRQILAVTFTNKATAEMKDRIAGVLYSLASGRQSPYLDYLISETGIDEAALRVKAGDLLEDILHNYSRFSVGTIDSFFQKIIRGFARETGLQSGFELELDNRRVLDKVIDRIMIETESNRDLQNWLMKYAESRIRDGLSWNFRKDIGRLGNQVFSETFMQFRQEMTDRLSDKSFMTEYLLALTKLKKDFESKMSRPGIDALDFIQQKGLEISDFSYRAAGVAGYFEKISSGKQFDPGKRVLDAVDNPESWYAKSSVKKTEITDAVDGGLNRMLKEALETFNAGYTEYLTANLILSNFYTLGILNDITRQTREYTEENNLFLLSDVASLLAGIISGNEAPFIYEKTGYFYRHFMIDEFQDTSRIQWRNFIPLITDSLSENNRNILVGDVKQSIYRWRNGDWRILAGEIEKEMNLFDPLVKPLEVNWRSKKNIVDFNNMLFQYSPEIMQEQFRNEYLDSALPEECGLRLQEQIATAYNEHSQKLPDDTSKDGGYVSVKFFDNEQGNWKADVLKNLPGTLADIISSGYSPRNIAILVRNHADGAEIAKRLLEWQSEQGKDNPVRLDFISEEFLLLQESVSVQLLEALIKFLSGPSDKINRAHIINLYCRYLGHAPFDGATDHDLFAKLDGEDEASWIELLPEEFTRGVDYLKQLSVYEMTEQLIIIFKLDDIPGEVPYLMAFQDAVLDYSRKEAGGAGLFAEWWDENSGRFSVSSSDRQDAIRIMTIHKAKGLQFKVVVIPFGDWRTDHNPMHDNFIWCRPDREPFSRLSLVPVKYKADLAGSIFVYDYFNEKMQVFVDNLNLLYVAFTRSEEELHVCAPMPGESRKNKDSVKSVSELLYIILSEYSGPHTYAGASSATRQSDTASADDHSTESSTAGLSADASAYDISTKLNIASDSLPRLPGSWSDSDKIFTAGSRVNPPAGTVADTGNELMLEKYRVNDFRDKLKLRLYGSLFFDSEGEAGKRIAHGRLMHEIFEKIITADDVEKAVTGKYHEGMIFADEVVPLAGEIKKLISDKRIAHWYSGNWRVRNETGILLKTGKTRRPDRVMISEGEVVVADYKFGEHSRPGYAGQVRRYMKELKNMGYENVKGFVWYVLSGELDEVKPNINK